MSETKRPLKVFLCHASADKPKVRELYRYLRKRGIQPWLDTENLLAGQDWQVEIPKAIASSDAIIICLSPNSVDKEGYVQKEIKFALDKGLEMSEGRVFLIPIRLEECGIPYNLQRYHWVNLFEADGYSKLMKSLKTRAMQLQRTVVEVAAPSETKSNLSEKVRLSLAKLGEQLQKFLSRNLVTIIPIVLISITTLMISLLGFWPQFFNQPSVATAIKTSTLNLTQSPKNTLTPSLTNTISQQNLVSTTPLPTIINSKDPITSFIPEGNFIMGSNDNSNEMPVHTIYLKSYYIDKYEVTNAMYQTCMDLSFCRPPWQGFNRLSDQKYANHPIVFVDWYMATAYCDFRDARLPTEAEWEKAARGTDGRTYPWGTGGNLGCNKTNYGSCIGSTTAVGSYESDKSPYDIYDMAGNVNEWIADWYSETYYQNSPLTNPLGPTNLHNFKVIRGGSWSSNAFDVRSTHRNAGYATKDGSTERSETTGFRCVYDIDQ